MLWFNVLEIAKYSAKGKFQYILCCGSTVLEIAKYSAKGVFQYILCCGSTFIKNGNMVEVIYFNTSYVVVQR